jgi:hypothetical protein
MGNSTLFASRNIAVFMMRTIAPSQSSVRRNLNASTEASALRTNRQSPPSSARLAIAALLRLFTDCKIGSPIKAIRFFFEVTGMVLIQKNTRRP